MNALIFPLRGGDYIIAGPPSQVSPSLVREYCGLVSDVWDKDCTQNLRTDAVSVVVFVSVETDSVVGGCWLESTADPELPAFFLNSLCVEESRRKRGIATEILQTVLNMGELVFLYVDRSAEHDRLVAFYCRTGFRVLDSPRKLILRRDVESLLVSTNVSDSGLDMLV